MVTKESYSKRLVDTFRVMARHIVVYAIYQPPTWPYSIIETNWYHSKFLPKLVYPIMLELEKKGFDRREIAKLFWGPSAITHWFYIPEATLADPKANPFEGLTVKEGIDFLERALEIISTQRKGDILCRDWRNTLLSYEDLEQTIAGREFIKTEGDTDLARKIMRLGPMLWEYCILIQVGHRAYSQEFHGPYALGAGKSLLIREYFNLKPTLVWGFSSDLPCDKIIIFEVYKDVGIQVDIFNHLYLPRKPENLVEFCIQTDSEKILTLEEIQDFFDDCNRVTQKATQAVANLRSEDYAKKTVQMRHLWLKPAMDVLKKDFRPPEDLYSLADRVEEARRAHEQFVAKMRAEMSGFSPNEAISKITDMFLKCVYREES